MSLGGGRLRGRLRSGEARRHGSGLAGGVVGGSVPRLLPCSSVARPRPARDRRAGPCRGALGGDVDHRDRCAGRRRQRVHGHGAVRSALPAPLAEADSARRGASPSRAGTTASARGRGPGLARSPACRRPSGRIDAKIVRHTPARRARRGVASRHRAVVPLDRYGVRAPDRATPNWITPSIFERRGCGTRGGRPDPDHAAGSGVSPARGSGGRGRRRRCVRRGTEGRYRRSP